MGVISHSLNPFQTSLEFERETPLLTPGAKTWPSPAETGSFTRCCPCWNKGAHCNGVVVVIKRKKYQVNVGMVRAEALLYLFCNSFPS